MQTNWIIPIVCTSNKISTKKIVETELKTHLHDIQSYNHLLIEFTHIMKELYVKLMALSAEWPDT